MTWAKPKVDPNNPLWVVLFSQRPGGEPLSSPGLFMFRRSQSLASLSFFWLQHHSSIPVTLKPATQPGSLHLRMQLSMFLKQRSTPQEKTADILRRRREGSDRIKYVLHQ